MLIGLLYVYFRVFIFIFIYLFIYFFQFEQIIFDLYDKVFVDDALVTSHPIYIPVNNPIEIGQIFDAISYEKVMYRLG